MSTIDTKQAVAVVDRREGWQNFQTELQQRANEIGAQLPSNVSRDRFLNVTIAAVKQTPGILVATPRSLFAAIAKAAQDGLMPDGREGVITVYNQKVPNTSPQQYENVAQWNPMAYGLRKRARELDGIIIDAQVVFDGDVFEYELGDEPRINHKPKPRAEQVDSSAGVAVYAIFRHPQEGILHREVMWKPEVFATMNQSRAKNSLMWTTFWTEGWRKAVVRRGMKSVPVSAKLEQVIARVDDDFEFDPVPPKQISRPTPPTPPVEDATEGAEDASQPDEPATERQETATEPAGEQHREEGEAAEPDGPVDVKPTVAPSFDGDTAPTPPAPPELDIQLYLDQIDETLMTAGDFKALDELWLEMNAPIELADDAENLEKATTLYTRHRSRLERKVGQTSLLDDMPEATRQAARNLSAG